MQLRRWISRAGAAVIALTLLAGCDADTQRSGAVANARAGAAAAQNLAVVTLYKNPSCACCGEWAEHMRENGFHVEETRAGWDLMQIKAEHGVSPNLASCHTALVGDYVLEGHVPADVVQELLAEKPEIRGLAVPGMPAGVPGMPEAGPNRAPYEILAIQQDGSTELYATR